MANGDEPKKAAEPKAEPGWQAYLRTHRRTRGVAVFAISILTPAAVAVAGYLCWWIWLPELWAWGFSPVTWRAILTVLGALYLVIIPLIPVAFAAEPVNVLLNMYAKDADERVRQLIEQATLGQDELEKLLQAEDSHGLVKLVRYSRLQLQAYYQIGLSQTQRSFRYSVIAMWIGFLVIVAGVVDYLVPETVFNIGARAPAQEFALLGGLIIELISAAFLWVYKSSINQLTYFYDRQQLNHNALLSFSVAETMVKKDAAKLKIIERLLEPSAGVVQVPLQIRKKAKADSKSDT